MKFFGKIVFVVFIMSIPIGSKAFAQAPDSCLKMYWISPDHIHDPNPDSVMADSCIGSSTYGSLYARQWFYVVFIYNILPVPIAPEDTIIDRSWGNIDTSYSTVRYAFDSLEVKFGGYFLRKVYPSLDDTSRLGAHEFKIRFNNYVNIDNVVTFLRTIPLLDTAESRYDMREVVKADVKDNLFIHKIMNHVWISRHQKLKTDFLKIFKGNYVVNCFDLTGRCILKIPTYLLSEELLFRLCNGSYILQSGADAIQIILSN